MVTCSPNKKNQDTCSVSRTLLSLVVDPDIQGPSHELNSIELRNGLLRILGRVEPNKTKSPLTSITAFGNFSTINLSTLTEVVFEFTPSSFPGKVSNKELTSLLGGSTLHVRVVVTVVVSTSASTMESSPVVSALFAVFTDKDGTSVKLGVLELTDGTGSFGGLLVDDDTAALGASVVSLENIGLD